MLPLGLYLMGDAPEEVASRLGNYQAWFSALSARSDARLQVADGRIGETLDLDDLAAVIISGSPDSLTDPQPWMDGGMSLLTRCQERGRPVLGVCFGHQLLGHYVGASVVRNPRGWEFGTTTIEIVAEAASDPLLAGCEPIFEANQAHQDIIDPASLPADVRVLARNSRTAVQALAIGDWARGVQFHPEFDGPVTSAYLQVRREALLDDAAVHGPERHPDRLEAHDCPTAGRIFSNFIEHFASRA
jgi:GMP synthase (glutamine-hydrolysing)